MSFFADLHVHSKYSRATSPDCDLEHLAQWAQKKGIAVVATGDFTHPAWARELGDKLVAAEPGLFRLRPDLEREVSRGVPPSCRAATRFMLSVEISTIYQQGERTRKVHHLVYAPDLTQAAAVTARLARIGNIAADGRPILGLPSRNLLEIVLEAAPAGFLVPAHIWTPWFSVLGSKSGFDSIADCYGDLAGHVFAAETGLSSDPPMNWRLSSLDRYRLISSSDAHSPGKLGREASVFVTPLDYFAMRRALETGQGFAGTVEFFPEEGKYHLDGHACCGARLTPAQTRASGARCPTCGKAVTVGVLHRVEALADRPEGARAAAAASFMSLVPLAEILGEVVGAGAASKVVQRAYENLLGRIGPELPLLGSVPCEDIRQHGGPLIAEALARLRRGEVTRQAGYDGEYGVIRVFAPGEIDARANRSLFPAEPRTLGKTKPQGDPQRGLQSGVQAPDLGLRGEPPAAAKPPEDSQDFEQPGCGLQLSSSGDAVGGHSVVPPASKQPKSPSPAAVAPTLMGLDPDQRAAASAGPGPLVIVAGPGAGKTRTLTHRIAGLVGERGVAPSSCLAITFTRRAADELRARLVGLLAAQAAQVTVSTVHALGLALLREQAVAAGVPSDFRVFDEAEREVLIANIVGGVAPARRASRAFATAKRTRQPVAAELTAAYSAYQAALRAAAGVDFEDLVGPCPSSSWNDTPRCEPSIASVSRGSLSTNFKMSMPPSTISSGRSSRQTATCARLAIPTSRSTAFAAPTPVCSHA